MLTDAALRNAKPRPKPYKLFVGGGLYLEVYPNESKLWRLKYRRADGSETRISLGAYPAITLSDARAERDRIKAQRKQERIDPVEARRTDQDAEKRKLGSTFAVAAEGWYQFKQKSWATETARKARYVLDEYLLPALGRKSMETMASKDVTGTLLAIHERAPVLARKARQYLSSITRYAQREGLRDESRALPLQETLPAYEKGAVPAAISPADIARVMIAIRSYPSAVVRAALMMCAYTALRPGVVVRMCWNEIEGDQWSIPGNKMKMREAHVVPLPRQAKALLENMRAYTAGREYVFPPLARQISPHLARDTLSAALRDMGFRGQHSPHGFRAMLRTAGRERLGVASDVLEDQLAHAKKGEVEKAYVRTTFTDERRKAMQRWADYLDRLANGSDDSKVVAIGKAA